MVIGNNIQANNIWIFKNQSRWICRAPAAELHGDYGSFSITNGVIKDIGALPELIVARPWHLCGEFLYQCRD